VVGAAFSAATLALWCVVTGFTALHWWRGAPLFVAPCLAEERCSKNAGPAAAATSGADHGGGAGVGGAAPSAVKCLEGLSPELGLMIDGDSVAGEEDGAPRRGRSPVSLGSSGGGGDDRDGLHAHEA
jgi:hypothetical protein